MERAYSPGHHGRWSARRRTELVDEAVRELGEGLPAGIALVATGGYGRRLLTPGSDIDLLVLHDSRKTAAAAKETAERVFYPFWDAGLALGHGVRDLEACVRESRLRIDVACSLLDARPLAGDSEIATRMAEDVRRALRRRRRDVLESLAADASERHDRFPSCATSLEPDLKEGAGGLRDLHTIGWIGAVAPDVDLLHDRERQTTDDAEEFLVRVRSALHLQTGRRTDRLLREHQPDLARAFGFDATAGLDAADALMRALFEHARQVEHILEEALERARGGRSPRPHAPASAVELVRSLAHGARGGRPDPGLVHAATDVHSPDAPWSEDLRRAFLDILAAGRGGGRAIEALDRAGLLVELLPEWEGVRCRPQRDPYHRFPVDVHLVQTMVETHALLDGADPTLVEAVESVPDRDALLLGALLHDIGKVGRGSHVAVGEEIAGDILLRIGAPEELADRVLFLVREHLLLSDTATRRDLSDPGVARGVAERAGDVGRLSMLLLLTVADAAATGPHASTAWRMGLVRELASRARHELEAGGPPPDVDPRAESAAARQRLLATPLLAAEVRTWARPGERAGTWDLTVVVADRTGLLARIAGSLALAGLSILAARATTTEDGIAIDEFTVEPAHAGEVDEERWRAVRRTIRDALQGRISLEDRVRRKRAHYPAPQTVPTEVRVLNDVSERATVVEVEAADRIGLLYDVARTFEELGLGVELAKVATYGPRVVDSFYVADAERRKVTDPQRIRELEAAIATSLEAGA